jgi:hypothetical protein
MCVSAYQRVCQSVYACVVMEKDTDHLHRVERYYCEADIARM